MTQPTGQDVVNTAVTLLHGAHYCACEHRCYPENWPHEVDCSGLITADRRHLGLIPATQCDGSFQIMRDVYAAGLQSTLDVARHTPGMVIARGINNGRGGRPGIDPGHIGFTVGDGVHSLEARGHWAGVGLFNIDSLDWSGAGYLPGVNYGPAVPGAPPEVKQPLPHVNVFQENAMHVDAAAVGKGHYLLGPDGGVFAYGGAPFFGSLPSIHRTPDLVFDWATSILPTPTGKGYWIGTAAGSVFTFGDAQFHGTFHGKIGPLQTVVKLFPNGSGYQAIQDDGTILEPA